MKRLKWILILILFATSLTAQSQLDDYLQIAAESNPELKAQYSLYLAALEKVDQQAALPDPTASFGFFISPVETRVGAQRFKISVSQMFPWMGTLKARKKRAASVAKAHFEQFQETKNQLFLKVKTKWLQLYELEQEITIMQANLNILESYEPITKTKYESNQVSLASLVRVQISIEQAGVQLNLLKLKRQPLQSEFNTLLNREADASISIIDTLKAMDSEPLSFDSALMNQPKVKGIQASLTAVDQELILADLKSKPNIGFGLDYGLVSRREGMVIEDNGKDILMPVVSLSLPIFGKKNKAVKKEVSFKKESLTHQLEAVENDLKNRWVTLQYEIDAASAELDLYKEEIDKTNVLLRILTSEYSNNNSDFEELLETQQRLLQLQLSQVRSQVRKQNALFTRSYLTGSTLTKFQ